MKEVIILAGGKGTRLREVVNDVAKPMAKINDRPFLEYVLDHLVISEFTDVYLSVGYMSETISHHFGDSYRSLKLTYVYENKPLGTGGAIKKCLGYIKGDYSFILNGDTFSNINFQSLESIRKETGDVVLAAAYVDDISRYGSLIIQDGILCAMEEKGGVGPGFINAGCYVLGKHDLQRTISGEPFSFEAEFLEKVCSIQTIRVCDCCKEFIDIGLPDDYFRAQKLLR